MQHYFGSIAPFSAKIQLPYFLSPKSDPLPPRKDFTSSDARLKYNQSTLSAFGIPTPPTYFESIFLDLYGPVGSLPFQVNGSNNTAELQAPLEAIAFMLLHPPLPPHVIFHLDSQYVLNLLLGLSLPSANLELAILLLDYYHYLSSQTCVELRKVKSHTCIPGNDRADLNANRGLSSHTSVGRFATFPPLDLPSIPNLNSPSAAPDSL